MITQEKFIEALKSTDFANYERAVKRGKEEYTVLNIAAAFDTETTTFAEKDGKYITAKEYADLPDKTRDEWNLHAMCYIWQFGISGIGTTYGRTLEDYAAFMAHVRTITGNAKLIVYVHNLAFDFQFIHKYFKWQSVFCIDSRTPAKAETIDGIVFKCSYIMTGKSLEKIGETVGIKKLKGDLDYNKIRHSETELTAAEMDYCEHDITIILKFISEQIVKEGNIENIPLTKTGYVRRDVRKYVLNNDGYKTIINRLKLSPEEYTIARAAFAGGFTHAGMYTSGKTWDNVGSYDITSSYPAQMIAGYFPMSRGLHVISKKVMIKDYSIIERYLKTKCCLMVIQWDTIESKYPWETYISKSHCKYEKCFDNNGRILYAEKVITAITEIDYEIIKHTYNVTGEKILDMYVYERGYLPKPLIEKVLYYYKGKTELRDVPGATEEYNACKESVNSIYGMMVTDIIRVIIEYTPDGYTKEKPDLETEISKYNKSRNRFTSYLWGIWITAHARRALWEMILAVGADYVYSDTDSVKFIYPEKHKEKFEAYNARMARKMEHAMNYHELPQDAWKPKNKYGKEKPLGYYHDEGVYSRFKTIGAKKYMTEKNGEIEITVAGIGKKSGGEHFAKIENETGDAFDRFEAGHVVCALDCGKTGARYIDHMESGIVTDYNGKTAKWKSNSSVALVLVGYKIGITQRYHDILAGVYNADFGGIELEYDPKMYMKEGWEKEKTKNWKGE